MKFVVASDNPNKLREFGELFAGTGTELVGKAQAGCRQEIEETGATFAENAYIKATQVCAAVGLPALADDSGLCVDALFGAPGVYSARFTGNHNDSDRDKCLYLLKKLRGAADRSARFVCSICCVLPNGDVIRAEGVCEGEILPEMRGENGFGYDPVFRPLGFSRSMAELSAEEKNQISHRGKALRAFQTEWERYIHDQQ